MGWGVGGGAQREQPKPRKSGAPKGHVRTGGVDDKGRKTTGNTSAQEVSSTPKGGGGRRVGLREVRAQRR